jgi:hypothetical protein
MGTSHEDICIFVIVSHWILLRMGNVSDKICGENQNTLFSINFFQILCHPCGNVWKYGISTQATNMTI